jgi:putative tryptophan/tyrosine transport system substrate-binding protein
MVDRFDQVPALARELVSRHPDVLIAGQPTFVMAVKQETTTIPIVMLGVFDPVQLGLITSLARPGGNVTGVAWFGLFYKPMELLKEIVPHLNRIAFFEGAANPPVVIKIGNESATVAAFRPVVASDYDEIFAHLAADHFDAAYIPGTPTNRRNLTRISQLALRHRIPTVSDQAEWAKSGLLLNYGQDVPWGLARGAEYVDKILRGAKPRDLPVEQATNFY